jgi:GNAT superfamily N-acetyltransferase
LDLADNRNTDDHLVDPKITFYIAFFIISAILYAEYFNYHSPMLALEIKPVTRERWGDLLQLFGPSGAYSGCWCMFWRVKSSEFESNGNKGNRKAMQEIVARNEIPGLLAYENGKPVGWISLGPKSTFGRIERSPLFKAIDDQPVWSVVCFFIDKGHRNTGVGKRLLAAATKYARVQGASILEAYPIDTKCQHREDAALFTGTQRLFEQAGFVEVARRKERRPVMRKKL